MLSDSTASAAAAAAALRPGASGSWETRLRPNFWSSWAVAIDSCVWACTPGVTRSMTLAVVFFAAAK